MALGTLAIGAVTISPFVAEVAFAGAETKTVKGDKPPTPTASEIETGQLLIKDKPVAKSSTSGQPPAPTASEIETGQLLIKDKPVSAAATGNDLCGLPYTPPCRSEAATAKKAADTAKTSFRGTSVITALLASAGAIGALVAFSGGNDGPTSP